MLPLIPEDFPVKTLYASGFTNLSAGDWNAKESFAFGVFAIFFTAGAIVFAAL